MAEIATIARPYAEALFKAGKDNLEEASVWVAELGALCANPQLQQFVSDPGNSDDQVIDFLLGLMKSKVSEQGKNFVALMVQNGRVAVMTEVASQFKVLKNAVAGVTDALVQTAFVLSDVQLDDLQSLLEKRFERKLNLVVEVVPALIGGVRVVVGDEVLDTSVKARVEQMRVALAA